MQQIQASDFNHVVFKNVSSNSQKLCCAFDDEDGLANINYDSYTLFVASYVFNASLAITALSEKYTKDFLDYLFSELCGEFFLLIKENCTEMEIELYPVMAKRMILEINNAKDIDFVMGSDGFFKSLAKAFIYAINLDLSSTGDALSSIAIEFKNSLLFLNEIFENYQVIPDDDKTTSDIEESEEIHVLHSVTLTPVNTKNEGKSDNIAENTHTQDNNYHSNYSYKKSENEIIEELKQENNKISLELKDYKDFVSRGNRIAFLLSAFGASLIVLVFVLLNVQYIQSILFIFCCVLAYPTLWAALYFGCHAIDNELFTEFSIMKKFNYKNKFRSITFFGVPIFVLIISLLIALFCFWNKPNSENDIDTNQVYYSETGERYHYDENCGENDFYSFSLDEALEKGLTPCQKCVE